MVTISNFPQIRFYGDKEDNESRERNLQHQHCDGR